MQLVYKRNGREYAHEAESLSKESIAYLLQYGWAQSLQDSIAGREKKVRDEYAAKWLAAVEANPELASDDDTIARHNDETELAILADIEGTLEKRMASILSGDITSRGSGGGERDTLASVARDMVRKAWVKQSGKGPTKADKAKFDELVAQVLADPARRAKVQAEYDRRQAESIDVEL
jgi:hypothetical protein